MRVDDIPEIARLTIPEKILLLEDLWDSIASEESSIPVPQSHREELDGRLTEYEKDPGRLLTLDDLRGRIEARR
jgi:putative addiction module component (TIGR02574 family)